MKITKFSEFSIPESSYNESEYLRLVESLDAHYQDMLYKKESIDQINEGIWDLIGTLGSGFEGRLKNYAAGWLLRAMGLPSDNNFLSEWAKNVVELISFRNIGNYFGTGSCKYWADAISKGLAKTVTEDVIDLMLSKGLGININFNGGIGGTLAGSIRDGLEMYLLSTKFVDGLAQKLEGVVCGEGTSFTNIFGGGKITPKEIATAAKAKTSGVTTDNASGDIKGILSTLGLNF